MRCYNPYEQITRLIDRPTNSPKEFPLDSDFKRMLSGRIRGEDNILENVKGKELIEVSLNINNRIHPLTELLKQSRR